jgi:hypothetical protein
MMNFTDMTTEELYNRIIRIAREASDSDLDEQDYYIMEIRMVIDAIEDRINEELENQDD